LRFRSMSCRRATHRSISREIDANKAHIFSRDTHWRGAHLLFETLHASQSCASTDRHREVVMTPTEDVHTTTAALDGRKRLTIMCETRCRGRHRRVIAREDATGACNSARVRNDNHTLASVQGICDGLERQAGSSLRGLCVVRTLAERKAWGVLFCFWHLEENSHNTHSFALHAIRRPTALEPSRERTKWQWFIYRIRQRFSPAGLCSLREECGVLLGFG